MQVVLLCCPCSGVQSCCGVQSGDAEKDKLRASLGSAILAERPNVKVGAQAVIVACSSQHCSNGACVALHCLSDAMLAVCICVLFNCKFDLACVLHK